MDPRAEMTRRAERHFMRSGRYSAGMAALAVQVVVEAVLEAAEQGGFLNDRKALALALDDALREVARASEPFEDVPSDWEPSRCLVNLRRIALSLKPAAVPLTVLDLDAVEAALPWQRVATAKLQHAENMPPPRQALDVTLSITAPRPGPLLAAAVA